MKRLTKAQATSLRYAKRKFSDGRVPPYLFRDYRTIKALIEALQNHIHSSLGWQHVTGTDNSTFPDSKSK